MTSPVALVTGAARRVGREVLLHLARSGYDCAFTFHQSVGEARTLVEAVEKLGRRCIAIRSDLGDSPAAPRAVAEEFALVYSRLDVLVHNASLYSPDQQGDTGQKQFLAMMNIHVASPLILTRELAPLMQRLGGCIISMVDILADRPMPGYLHYCASKAALQSLTLGLARELAPKVRVLGIAPGVVDWPDDMPVTQRQAYLKRVPLARAGSPADVARLIHFLATEGQYLTGQTIRLDGGRAIVS